MAELRFEARMSDVEALLWRLEAHDPRLRSTITAAAVFDRSPGVDAVRARVERLSRLVPRLRERVVDEGPAFASPRWERDPEFDLAVHLRAVRAPAGGPGRGVPENLLRMVEPWSADPFDALRSPWQMLFVEGLAAGRAALVLKLHHTFTDGIGAVELASVLFDLEGDAAEPSVPLLPPPPPPPGDGLGHLAGELLHEATRTAGVLRRAAAAVTADVAAFAWDPWPAARNRLDVVTSLAGLAAPATRPRSPVMVDRSTRCRLAALEVGLEGLRRAGKVAGGTVNDAFVAGLLGGLRRYHERHGSRPAALRLAVPVSTRDEPASAAMRNSVVPVRFDAPLQVVDPVERMGVVHGLLAAERARHGLGAVEHLAVAATRLAPLRAILSASTAGIDAVASNVPGGDVPLYLAGARVVALVPFGPRTRAALNATALSYHGTMGIGLNIDPCAVPDADRLVESIRSGMDETVAVGKRRRRS